ncbi:MAG: hypothetical protein ACLQJF_21140 [Candidatus Sulfotelmatobacter sp.]|jgi:hypothetical protein
MEDNQSQEPEAPEAPQGVKRRNRMKSPRQQLHDSLRQFDEMLNNPNLKETKKAEVLIERASIQKMLYLAERGDDRDAAILENETLKTQHEKDTSEIERLRATPARHYEPVTLQDPETPRLRQENQELKGLVSFIASEITDPHARACIGIRAVLKWGSGARPVFDALGLDIRFYFQGLSANPKVDDLQANLSRCADPDSENAVYTRAALEVLHGVKVPKPVRRVRNSDTRDYASLCPDLFNE